MSKINHPWRAKPNPIRIIPNKITTSMVNIILDGCISHIKLTQSGEL
jgi:hypothetical protein